MRVELPDELRTPDHDPEVRTKIVRGAGICFSAGCDLSGGRMMEGALLSIPHPVTDSGRARTKTPGSAFGEPAGRRPTSCSLDDEGRAATAGARLMTDRPRCCG